MYKVLHKRAKEEHDKENPPPVTHDAQLHRDGKESVMRWRDGCALLILCIPWYAITKKCV